MKAKILLVYTGGTIGMFKNPETGTLQPFDFEKISEYVPDLQSLDIQVDTHSFEKPLDSSNIMPEIWLKLVKIIKQNYYDYDGFVILHGTDTMAYTGSALSFLLQNLNKPVILTGSQLPIGMIRTDGKENLITSIEIAAAKKPDGLPRVPEVAIFFGTKLFRANRTHKNNASYFDAFESPNYPPLAEAGIQITFFDKNISSYPENKLINFYEKICTKVASIKLFPGLSKEYVSAVLNLKGLKALVLETYGAGNAPTEKWFLDELKQAIDKGIIVYNVSQCAKGTVLQGRYETSRKLAEIGVISGYDITFEAAITKLMFLLGQNFDKKTVEYYMSKSIAGEMTVK